MTIGITLHDKIGEVSLTKVINDGEDVFSMGVRIMVAEYGKSWAFVVVGRDDDGHLKSETSKLFSERTYGGFTMDCGEFGMVSFSVIREEGWGYDRYYATILFD